MRKREPDTTQFDLLDWAEKRPTAQIIDWIPHLAKRMWRDRYVELPHYDPHIIPLRRQA